MTQSVVLIANIAPLTPPEAKSLIQNLRKWESEANNILKTDMRDSMLISRNNVYQRASNDAEPFHASLAANI